MNCQSYQNQILGLADPAELVGPLAGHVAGCDTCQAWHRLLIQVEHAAANLPVPKAVGNGKAQLLKQFRTEKASDKASKATKKPSSIVAKQIAPAPSVVPKPPGDRIARMWPMGILAGTACVAIVLIIQGTRKPAPEVPAYAADPMLERVVAAKVQLDVAVNAPERLKVLARLAEDVQDQTKSLYLLNVGDEMASLSKMYEEIVTEGLVAQANALDANERQALLGTYTDRLAKAEQQAERMAAEAPYASAPALKEIAATARQGKTKLAKLREKQA